MNKYEPVIGLEIHVELSTKSKMFCQCSANYFGKEPNSNTCPVCLGMPGALPVPNRQAVESTIKIGQALKCKINQHSKFDRKHYFYPDLAKGYQISQYDQPIAEHGELTFYDKKTNEYKTFHIQRIHLEEDTGKLTHADGDTLVDFNRCSVPLVEIVTEPEFRNSDDVKQFLEELHTLIEYLDVSDADMEKGSMRMEPNISIRPIGQKDYPPYKVEVKNINSFNFAKKAVEFELVRQAEILDRGEIPAQETRGYNEDKQETYSQRTKENAKDYRYFPEPDIPPMVFSDELLEKIKQTLPELPFQRFTRLVNSGVSPAFAIILTQNVVKGNRFDEIFSVRKSLDPNLTASAIVNNRISTDISVAEAADKAEELLKPKETDTGALTDAIEKAITANPKVYEDYKAGKTNSIMFFVGQVMREMKGKADASVVKQALEKRLEQ
ncbi:MAG: Asp-tRNA(Asn)/Glu-tRNA(Gln) amidotransferase subunit GatB [Weeksellaceae bacterium]